MPHHPVNHRLARFYRTVGGLVGVYVLAFGILGVIRTRGSGLFARDEIVVLGLRSNLAFAIVSIIVGLVIVLAAVGGGVLPHFVDLYGGWVFIVVGLGMLASLQTDADFLNFSVATCAVSFLFGLALLAAGLYNKVGPREEAEAEEAFRHYAGPNPRPSRLETEGHEAHRPLEEGSPEGHRFA